mmetsp:Transcript_5454/g.7370  ORF Transcript_5454/g.7370 Transcript_5454/m.7370 type:complete len:195 (-) Transcript_5454:80-664(-)|eukprot:CAMPEP_0196576096 /NCGR_PEP_ID=MMETSP1081-20130531/5446_1 /TAXON_ID=36882 /ORGANISM="Pyramimonas amylifera, Strain CCMP720" /LENGTH=194 /DNA_ID=CAMNT_0041894607 /DNA_START=91 /DNA_END=675 /DNA_ORIENTATION=-
MPFLKKFVQMTNSGGPGRRRTKVFHRSSCEDAHFPETVPPPSYLYPTEVSTDVGSPMMVSTQMTRMMNNHAEAMRQKEMKEREMKEIEMREKAMIEEAIKGTKAKDKKTGETQADSLPTNITEKAQTNAKNLKWLEARMNSIQAEESKEKQKRRSRRNSLSRSIENFNMFMEKKFMGNEKQTGKEVDVRNSTFF